MSYVVLCEECCHDIGSHGHDGCTEHFGGGCSQTATDIARALVTHMQANLGHARKEVSSDE